MKFSGKVGFLLTTDRATAPGVYKPLVVERKYRGDVVRNLRRSQETQYQNDNVVLNSKISILADMYVQNNYQYIQYVVWNDVAWKVTSIDISSYPRVYIELGGVYNGKIKTGSSDETGTDSWV